LVAHRNRQKYATHVTATIAGEVCMVMKMAIRTKHPATIAQPMVLLLAFMVFLLSQAERPTLE